MEKGIMLMRFQMLTPEDRENWLKRIHPEPYVIDGAALAEMMNSWVDGKKAVAAMGADEIVDFVNALQDSLWRDKKNARVEL